MTNMDLPEPPSSFLLRPMVHLPHHLKQPDAECDHHIQRRIVAKHGDVGKFIHQSQSRCLYARLFGAEPCRSKASSSTSATSCKPVTSAHSGSSGSVPAASRRRTNSRCRQKTPGLQGPVTNWKGFSSIWIVRY